MKIKPLCTLVLVAFSLIPPAVKAGKDKITGPTGWGYASQGPIDVKPTLMRRPAPTVHLGRGALVAVMGTKSGKKGTIARVRAVDPANLRPQIGMVQSGEIENIPLDRYPSDQELLKLVGGVYLDDVTASNAQISRYLVRQGKQEPALLCFIGASILPQARLQVFLFEQGKLVPGPFIEFPTSELKMAITSIEVQDLVGDGNECVVTREPFVIQTDNQGVNFILRRIEGKEIKALWQAPIQFRHTAAYPPKLQILQPPEENIGKPGTRAEGTVEFRDHGALHEPVWKGKVSFFVVGREDAIDSVNVEKLCPWDGSKFAPLRRSR
jgi:hypothetical protein